jgi:hypothetical protein
MSEAVHTGQGEDLEFDPVFLHSRREAIIIFFVWLAAFIWAVPYCYFNGYVDATSVVEIDTVWGIPSWVFWGIGAPWIAANIFTTWFCFCYMEDDDLGEAMEGADIAEEVSEMHADDKGANA